MKIYKGSFTNDFIDKNLRQYSIPVYQRNLGNHKKIYQYDLNKKLVKEYESVAEAARITGFQKEYLAKTAKAQKKAYNFFWSYEEMID